MLNNPSILVWNLMTSKQKDEQLYLMKKAHEEFWWNRFYLLNRLLNSIALNTTYKFSKESRYDFIKRIKIKCI